MRQILFFLLLWLVVASNCNAAPSLDADDKLNSSCFTSSSDEESFNNDHNVAVIYATAVALFGIINSDNYSFDSTLLLSRTNYSNYCARAPPSVFI